MNHGLEMFTAIPIISNQVRPLWVLGVLLQIVSTTRNHLITLGVADPKNLMPMYKKLHSAIREHDDNHIILFEPTIIITSVSSYFFEAIIYCQNDNPFSEF